MRDETHDGLIESSAMERRGSAFTLVELVMVLAVCSLLVAGLAIRGVGDEAMQRRVACERVMRWVESARREAVVRRRPVLLGIRPLDGAGPGEPACKAAMFALDAWPPSVDRRVFGDGLSSWWVLDRGGVIFDPGSGDEEVNPMCGDAIEVVDRSLQGRSVFVNAMVFDADGRLVYPEGTLPVAMRLVAARWDSMRGCWVPLDGGDHQDCIRIGRHGGRAMVLQK